MYKKVLFLFCICLLLPGCNKGKEEDVAITSIDITSSLQNLRSDGFEVAIEYIVTPRNANLDNLKFISSNPDLLSINNGKIIPKKAGDVVIEVTNNDVNLGKINVNVRPFKLYSIGNSHTADYSPHLDFPLYVKESGLDISVNYHIACGKTIDFIINNPDWVCAQGKYNSYKQAINSEIFDAITIQPYYGKTGENEINAIKLLIKEIKATKNKNADIYIYYTWPTNNNLDLQNFDYTKAWEGPFYEYNKLIDINKGFLDYIKNELKNENIFVKYIMFGEFLNSFHQLSVSGQIDKFQSAGELYRDSAHMNNVGRFFAGLTIYSMLFNSDFIKTENVSSYPKTENSSDKKLTPSMIISMVDIIKTFE